MPYSPRDVFYDVVTLRDPDGFLIPLADIRVSVYTVDNNGAQGALATIYGSRTGGATGNQFITGADGVVKFWAAPGDYNIIFEDTQGTPRIAANTIGWQALSGKAEGILMSELPATIQNLAVPGEIKAYGGDVAPAGYVLCDGSTYDGTVAGNYAALYDVIGTKFGGTGRTSFKVPDTRGRMLVGKGTHADVDVVGESDAVSVGSRTPNHGHGLTITAESPTTNTQAGHTHGGNTGNTSPGTNSAPDHSHQHFSPIGDVSGYPTVISVEAPAVDGPNGASYDFYDTWNTVTRYQVPSASGAAVERYLVTSSDNGGHSHTVNSHGHSISSDGSHSHTVNSHSHAGSSIAVGTSPYLVVNHIIKL